MGLDYTANTLIKLLAIPNFQIDEIYLLNVRQLKLLTGKGNKLFSRRRLNPKNKKLSTSESETTNLTFATFPNII